MDTALHDVRGQLRRRSLKNPADGLDNGSAWAFHGFMGLGGREGDGACRRIQLIHTPDKDRAVLIQRHGGSKVFLDILRRLAADQNAAFAPEIIGDGVVEFIASHLDALGNDQAAEGDDRDIGGPCADVDDQVPDRVINRQTRTDGSGKRLLDQEDMLRSGHAYGFGQRFAVYIVQPTGDGDDDLRLPEIRNANRFPDEIFKHQFGNVKISNLAIADRRDGNQGIRRAPVQEAGFIPDGTDSMAVFPVKDHERRLGYHDAPPSDVDIDIFRTQVDTDIRSQ